MFMISYADMIASHTNDEDEEEGAAEFKTERIPRKVAREANKLRSYVHDVLRSAFVYSLLLDRELRIIDCSDGILKLFRVPEGTAYIGVPIQEACRQLSIAVFKGSSARVSRILSGEYNFSEDETIQLQSGEKRIFRMTYRQVLDENGDFNGVLMYVQDLTDLRLEEAERRLNDLLTTTMLPCMIWDEKGNVIAYNDEIARIFGAPADIGPDEFNNFILAIQPELQPDGSITETLRQTVIRESLEKGFSQVIVRLEKKDGTPIYFTVNATRVSWLFGFRLVVYLNDMTDIMAVELLSMTDQLTDIPNRRSFDKRMESEWRRATRDIAPLSLLMLDVDRFKIFNDTFGHMKGDTALQCVAEALQQSLLRPADFAARWGGEEFAVLLPGTDEDGALMIAERIRAAIECTPIVFNDGTSTSATVSIGINTKIPKKNDSVEGFISGADGALYTAKRMGRNRVCTGHMGQYYSLTAC